MTGEVVHIHQQRGMVAVLTETGEYSIIELLGAGVEVGDKLLWQGSHPLGSRHVTNVTRNHEVRVFFQNHCVPESQLRQQLLY